MDITAQTPRTVFTVQGLALKVPSPFDEGHVLTEAESQVMNQTYAENIRNNLASKIKAASDKNEPYTPVQAQSLVDEYVKDYEFGTRAGRVVDPVLAQALAIAEAAVKRTLLANGRKLRDYDRGTIRKLAEGVLEKNPSLMKAAERRVRDEQKALEDLDIAV